MNMFRSIETDTALEGGDETRPRRSLLRRLAWIALPLAAIGGGYALLNGGAAPMAAPQMAAVTVATPLAREITLWDDYVGRFEASRSVEVRPRIAGAITAVHFTDGQVVKKGQPLFTIDARPFRAALAEAQAGVATAKSDLALARTDLARAERLIEADAVSQGEVDRLRARVQAAQAGLAGAQARVNSRALDVEFTTVRAPIAGRISDRRIDAGNLVSAGDGPTGTLLTTINALDPIYFTFTGSEALFLKAKRDGAGNGAAVQVRLQDEADYRWAGKLDFTDNSLDPRSGTIRGRALLDNPKQFLTPGMFGRMRLATAEAHQALLVPDTAVQTDQTRKTLLVLDKDDKVAVKAVTLGPVVDGLRVITAGLAPDDRVIINGTQFAMPGSQVRPEVGKFAPTAPTAGAADAGMAVPGQATFAR